MTAEIRLSVLDQSPIGAGSSAAKALRDTIESARRCDRLGFHRYWVAEHHGTDSLACQSPEVLLARLGAETRHIRIGSGGVMLPHYSPYKVAENFKMLQSLYPDRIDLGIGRAPGTDPFTSAALRYGSTVRPEHFPSMVSDLQAFLTDSNAVTQGIEQARAFPTVEIPPEMWMLGSSEKSAVLAGRSGLPYNFAYFLNPNIDPDIFQQYRKEFQKNHRSKQANTCLTVFAVCAESAEEASLLARSRDIWVLQLLQGTPKPFLSKDDARKYPFSHPELEFLEKYKDKRAVGTPKQVKAKLLELTRQFAADEIMLLTITHDLKSRLRSHELLAAEWGLTH